MTFADYWSVWGSKGGPAAAITCFVEQVVMGKPNLQRTGPKAKVYQVRQVRDIILKNKLGEEI